MAGRSAVELRRLDIPRTSPRRWFDLPLLALVVVVRSLFVLVVIALFVAVLLALWSIGPEGER